MRQMGSRVHRRDCVRGRGAGHVVRARPNQGEVAPTALTNARGGKLPSHEQAWAGEFGDSLTIDGITKCTGIY
jgi:hypothetical protein